MAKRAIIRLGDPTSHGGTVLEAFPTLTIYGKNAVGIGHRGYCPQCKSEFVIVAGVQIFRYLGKDIAVEGMLTSCGAVLIATQEQALIDDSPDSSQQKINPEVRLLAAMAYGEASTAKNPDEIYALPAC